MTKKNTLLVLKPLDPEHQHQLDTKYNCITLNTLEHTPHLYNDVAIVVTSNSPGFDTNLLNKLPALKLVASSSVGVDKICVAACNARGVEVCHTPNVLNDDVADMAMMLMLNSLRQYDYNRRWIESGKWENQGPAPLTSCAYGKNLGIVGLGRIGKAIAKRAAAFGMNIQYHGRHKQLDVPWPYYADLKELATESDILLLCIPASNATHKLVTADILASLGSQGILINVARGSVIDQDALIDALTTKTILAAGLDVFEKEPHVPQALLDLDNVALQPHAASATHETRFAMSKCVFNNIEQYIQSGELFTPITASE